MSRKKQDSGRRLLAKSSNKEVSAAVRDDDERLARAPRAAPRSDGGGGEDDATAIIAGAAAAALQQHQERRAADEQCNKQPKQISMNHISSLCWAVSRRLIIVFLLAPCAAPPAELLLLAIRYCLFTSGPAWIVRVSVLIIMKTARLCAVLLLAAS